MIKLARALSSSSLSFSIPCLFPNARKRVSAGEMTKVHPNVSASASASPMLEEVIAAAAADATPAEAPPEGEAEELTVWRRSLLFNGNGFTVFDHNGNLVFRVDNYASENKGEIVLMDAAGKTLLTIRRKRLSLVEHWLIYDGEELANPRFSVKKHVKFMHSKTLAHVAPCGLGEAGYHVEGSYARRCCVVYDGSRRQLAEISRKEAASSGVVFGLDVFRLIVHPCFDAPVAMAIVILLEQMFRSRGPFIRV